MIYTKTHKKHLDKKVAHHVSIHEEKGHVEMKGKIPKKATHENIIVWKTTTIALAILLILSILTQGFSDISMNINADKKINNKLTTGEVDEKLPVELYVMSKCPYGVQAENTMFAAIQEIGEKNVNLTVEYIATDLGEGQFNSLHGEKEVLGDKVQLCARNVDHSKYLDLVLCMNKDANSIPENWETCAESLGYDVKAIKECYEGDKGIKLLQESAAVTNARGATGSPTIYVNNERYTGGREVIDFKRAFCQAFPSKIPESCRDVPPAKKFELVVLNDKTCTACDTTNILGATKNFFPGVQIKEVDVNTKEGKDLIKKYGIEVVPTYIFAPDVVETNVWKDAQFQTNFDKLDDGSYKLKDAVTQATWFIDKEKQKEHLAKMGIVAGDNKPQIDFFVMSFCPYGNQAEEAMVGTYDMLKDDAEFFPHYIYYENYQGGGPDYCLDNESKYCSMHGAVEARENIREQCVQAKYGTQAWFDFATAINTACDSKNADTCYVDVAKNLGYDTDYIATCEKENALTFAAEDARLMALFGASGSPSVYIDGVPYNGARSASGYEAGLCAAFDDAPASCDDVKVVETPANTAPATGSC